MHPSVPDGDWVQLWVGGGRRAGLRPGDLVGAIANEAGVPGSVVGEIQLFDTTREGRWTRRPLEIRTPSVNWSLAFAAQGRTLLAGCEDGNARLFNAADGGLLMEPLLHEGCVAQVLLSPDRRFALTTCRSDNSAARVWSMPGYEHLGRCLPQPAPLRDARWLADGASLWTAPDNQPMLRYCPDQPFPIENWSLKDGALRFAVFAPDGKRAVAQDETGAFASLRLPGQEPIASQAGFANQPK